eukprot:6810618-Prymnesium_polylepis.1
MQHALVAHRSPPARSEPQEHFQSSDWSAECVNVKKVGCCTNFSALWRTLCLLAQRRPAR